ncbi:MAG: pyridoxamine 5'-phosphate oxidase family protein [Pseudomonadales bacterium]|nr:pyridoxamine 5'-phosphate oxidase family protein [Pseudomonadales bacterium]
MGSIEELENIYGEAAENTQWKELDRINDHYRQFIEKSPFLILATHGEKSVDCSPRGDPAGFVRVLDERHIMLPDRRGNNRLDSLRNIIHNPNVGIIFLIPNVGETIRLSGKAEIVVDEALCNSFSINGKPASSVLSVKVDKVYYQCQKAIARSKLWDASAYIERTELPSAGQMNKVFAASKNIDLSAKEYDRNYPAHMKKTIY